MSERCRIVLHIDKLILWTSQYKKNKSKKWTHPADWHVNMQHGKGISSKFDVLQKVNQ